MKRGSVPVSLRRKVMKAARNRCGYCLAPQYLSNIPLEVEHIIPPGAGGTDEEDNLWASCSACNGHKSNRTHARDPKTGRTVRLFNPRKQKWTQHFRWDATGTRVVGTTACGRATVEALCLNDELAISARMWWKKSGWFPPGE